MALHEGVHYCETAEKSTDAWLAGEYAKGGAARNCVDTGSVVAAVSVIVEGHPRQRSNFNYSSAARSRPSPNGPWPHLVPCRGGLDRLDANANAGYPRAHGRRRHKVPRVTRVQVPLQAAGI